MIDMFDLSRYFSSLAGGPSISNRLGSIKIGMYGWMVAALIVLGRSLVAAQDQQPKPDLTETGLEDLRKIQIYSVYSASKYQQKVTDAPSSVSIVTADEIKKYGHRTLADILRSVR